MERAVKSREEMQVYVRELVADAHPHTDHATVWALSGDLGAGKTTFSQCVAEALGVEDVVTSPTFVIQKIYRLPEASAFDHLIHIDAYRLEGGGELVDLGWHNLLDEPTNIVLIEWPERVSDVIPDYAERFTFEHVNETTRRITTDHE